MPRSLPHTAWTPSLQPTPPDVFCFSRVFSLLLPATSHLTDRTTLSLFFCAANKAKEFLHPFLGSRIIHERKSFSSRFPLRRRRLPTSSCAPSSVAFPRFLFASTSSLSRRPVPPFLYFPPILQHPHPHQSPLLRATIFGREISRKEFIFPFSSSLKFNFKGGTQRRRVKPFLMNFLFLKRIFHYSQPGDLGPPRILPIRAHVPWDLFLSFFNVKWAFLLLSYNVKSFHGTLIAFKLINYCYIWSTTSINRGPEIPFKA